MKIYRVMDDCCGEVATVKWERYSRRTRRRWVVSWASGRAPEGFDRFEDAKDAIRQLRHSHNLRFVVASGVCAHGFNYNVSCQRCEREVRGA